MLAVRVLANGGRSPADGPILVTGATGGVGSLAVAFLSRRGYDVVASTGKADEGGYLRGLGASEIVPRSDLSRGAAHPLDTSRWSGAVDSVGGSTLEAILSAVKTHGIVASCGLAGGAAFSTTVFPFILRGVSLVGIDSNTCPMSERLAAWTDIGELLDEELAGEISHDHPLGDVLSLSEDIIAGRIRGRAVIDVNA
jgi:acrylyl-CoA reductase (NADPH)